MLDNRSQRPSEAVGNYSRCHAPARQRQVSSGAVAAVGARHVARQALGADLPMSG